MANGLLTNLDNLFSSVAKHGGNSFVIDTDEEKQEIAFGLFNMFGKLWNEDSHSDDLAVLRSVIKQTDYERPLFGKIFFIYHGYNHAAEEDRMTAIVLTAEEWERITNPFHEQLASIDDAAVAIERAVAIFEDIAGEKAGTKDDIGAMRGNLEMEAGRIKGQQDCVDEYLTTRQLITALAAMGFLKQFRFDPDNDHTVIEAPDMAIGAQVAGGITHKAVQIFDGEGNPWAVDSWFGNNGQTAVVLFFPEWQDYFKRCSSDGCQESEL